MRLRAELRRLLAVFRAFPTLLVVAPACVGARLALDSHLHIPPEDVLLYVLVFAAMLGLFYIVASSAIDARAGRLLDELVPLPDPLEPQSSDQIGQRAADRGTSAVSITEIP